MTNREKIVSGLRDAVSFARGENVNARVTIYGTLPPIPWNWVTSDSPSGNGAFHIYLVDANGRKIAALWGNGQEKRAMAERIVALANVEKRFEPNAIKEIEDGVREAVRVLDLMGRGGAARDLARHGHNLRAALRRLIEGWDTGADATEEG